MTGLVLRTFAVVIATSRRHGHTGAVSTLLLTRTIGVAAAVRFIIDTATVFTELPGGAVAIFNAFIGCLYAAIVDASLPRIAMTV